jgi:hypothetical protein
LSTRIRLVNLIGRGWVREVGTSPQDPKLPYFLALKSLKSVSATAKPPKRQE